MEMEYDISIEDINEFLTTPYESEGEVQESVGVEDSSFAAYNGDVGAYLGDAGMTVLVGLVVVLATLLALTGIFYLFGFVMKSVNQPKKPKKAKTDDKVETVTLASTEAPTAPVVQEGISGEVVAAIAAAVAMMAPEGKRYALKSVNRRDSAGRSAWAAAGVADNTRPF